MYRFENPNYFWLLLLVPMLIYVYIRFLAWRKKGIAKLGTERMSQRLLRGKIDGRSTTKISLAMGAIIATIFGLANLQAGDQSTAVNAKGVDVVFALDVSKSMLAKDISPDRLTKSKIFIQTILSKMNSDRAGLVIFAGRAYLQSPLTSDYATLRMLLNAVGPSSAPTQGTVLGEAIEMSRNAFNSKDKKFKTIVLISDGEDHDEDALEQAKDAADEGIIIHTIGIGSALGAAIFDPETGANKLDENGKEVITKLNEDELKEIAKAGHGTYHLLQNSNTVADDVLSEVDKMEGRNLGSRMFVYYKSYYQYFLLLAVLLLIINAFIPAASKTSLISKND